MYKKVFLVVVTGFVLALANSTAQDKDPVLFTVEKTPVHVSEFNYIYSKTNGDKADYSEASVMEYLDLYKKFKLKVQRAKEMKLDDDPALQAELAGYRKQLSNSYLMDRELTENLVKEAYDRSNYDVNVSHILVAAEKNASTAEVAAANRKIKDVYTKLKKGEDFKKLAAEFSSDPSAKENGGEIGYLTALQLPNFYALESAAYNTPVGKFSEPVRTSLGFHIVKVNDKRPARGEINVAHILVRVEKGAEGTAQEKRIREIASKVAKGEKFEEVARFESEDQETARRGGEVGFFPINTYDAPFENAAFSLKKDGDVSKPFRSSVGWHIVKRLELKKLPEYELAKGTLLTKVKRDERFSLAKDDMINGIKKANSFKENSGTFNSFSKGLSQEFLSSSWKPVGSGSNTLFSIGSQKVSLGDFTNYLLRNQNLRFRKARGNSPEGVAKEMYKEFVDEEVFKFEENQLEKRYPEFKALMREYEEGILLFEATKQMVWDKASDDTTGLKSFYSNNKEKYNWAKRAKASLITVNSSNDKVIAKAKKLASKKSADVLMAKMNKVTEVVTVKSDVYEEGRNSMVDACNWKVGATGTPTVKDGKTTFAKILELLPTSPKSLKEARGYVVADYQDYLEKQWVNELQKSYSVVVDDSVLKSIIR